LVSLWASNNNVDCSNQCDDYSNNNGPIITAVIAPITIPLTIMHCQCDDYKIIILQQ